MAKRRKHPLRKRAHGLVAAMAEAQQKATGRRKANLALELHCLRTALGNHKHNPCWDTHDFLKLCVEDATELLEQEKPQC